MKSWDKLVEEGQELAAQISDNKFALGDLAIEVTKKGEKKLQEYAEEIGVPYNSLREYRRVAEAWHPARRLAPSVSFSVHQDLARVENREEVLRDLARQAEKQDKRLTVNMVREARGAAPANYPKPDPETRGDRVSAAKELLSDPEVASEVVSDDRTRASIVRAEQQVDAERRATTSRRQREDSPGLHETSDFVTALGHIVHARSDVNKALDLLRDLPPIDSERRDELHDVLSLLEPGVEWLRRIANGEQQGLVDEIERFLVSQQEE